jgi:ribonuclease HI
MTDTLPYKIYNMEIIGKDESFYHINITSGNKHCIIIFNPLNKQLIITNEGPISEELKNNIYQLQKILHNKRTETFFLGFKLNFILRNNDSAIALNDLNKLVVLDRRNSNYLVSSREKEEKDILKIYTDGCYLEKKKKGAYIALIEKPNGLLNLYFSGTKSNSSSLIELLAVIEGLKHAANIECLRVISDSRYIIKGLTEWMFNWKLNDWHTAQGNRVKNIRYWKMFDKLTQGKYIEFEWVKSHSNHYYNSICDYYAKQAAMRI